MNKNQVAGAAKDAIGRAERRTGELGGNDEMQVKCASSRSKAASSTQAMPRRVVSVLRCPRFRRSGLSWASFADR